MTTLKRTHLQEQNANTLAGVQLDTTQVGGTAAGDDTVIRFGKVAPFYELTGTATALARVTLLRENAYKGAVQKIARNNAAPPAFGVTVYDNTTALAIATIPAAGTAAGTDTGNGIITCVFDGEAWQGAYGG